MGDQAPILIDKGQKSSVTTQTELADFLTAPVARGQRIGTLRLRAGEQILREVPLIAGNAVERLSSTDLFCMVLGKICMAKQ